MGDRGEGNNRVSASYNNKRVTEEQLNYLLELFKRAGIDIDDILRKKLEKKQDLQFRDELIVEVYDKNGKIKDRRVI